jgi:hypothetical protein
MRKSEVPEGYGGPPDPRTRLDSTKCSRTSALRCNERGKGNTPCDGHGLETCTYLHQNFYAAGRLEVVTKVALSNYTHEKDQLRPLLESLTAQYVMEIRGVTFGRWCGRLGACESAWKVSTLPGPQHSQ